NVIFNGVAALDPHQRREFVLLMNADNIVRRESHFHFVRMARRLLIDAVNQVHGTDCITAFEAGFDPYGEKFRAQIAFPYFVEVNLPFGDGSNFAQIEIFIEKALGGVRMRINNQCRLVNALGGFRRGRFTGMRALLRRLMPGLPRLGQRYDTEKSNPNKKEIWLHSPAILSAILFASRHSVYRSEIITWKQAWRRSSAASIRFSSRRFLR